MRVRGEQRHFTMFCRIDSRPNPKCLDQGLAPDAANVYSVEDGRVGEDAAADEIEGVAAILEVALLDGAVNVELGPGGVAGECWGVRACRRIVSACWPLLGFRCRCSILATHHLEMKDLPELGRALLRVERAAVLLQLLVDVLRLDGVCAAQGSAKRHEGNEEVVLLQLGGGRARDELASCLLAIGGGGARVDQHLVFGHVAKVVKSV